MHIIENQIIQKATWKKAALFTVIFAVFYILINYSGVGVAGLLKITGGRSFYLTKILPLDFPFPFTYMLFYAGWIALLIKHAAHGNWCRYLLFIPVLAMLCDWMENLGIISLLNCYPDLPVCAVLLASIAGMLKAVFTICSIIVIGLLFIMFLVKNAKSVKENSPC